MQNSSFYYPDPVFAGSWGNPVPHQLTNEKKQQKEEDDQIWTIDRLFSQNGTVDFSTKKKKKFAKCPNLNSHHFRVFKNDIRRCYAAMVANVLNSSDFNLIRAFLVRYGVQNMNFLLANDPFGVYDPRYNRSFHCNLTGFDTIACYLGVLTNTAPDYSFHVHDTQIRIRSDSPGSLVIANYTVQGTHLYECSMELILKDLLQAFSEFNKVRKFNSFSKHTNAEEPITMTQQPSTIVPSCTLSDKEGLLQEDLNFVALDAHEEDSRSSSSSSNSSRSASAGSDSEFLASLPIFEKTSDSSPAKKRKIVLEDEDLPFFNTSSASIHSYVATNYLNETEMTCFHAYVKRIEQLWAMRKSNEEGFLAPARFPFAYTISGKLTIELDEDKKIQGIAFNRGGCMYSFTNYSSTPPPSAHPSSNNLPTWTSFAAYQPASSS